MLFRVAFFLCLLSLGCAKPISAQTYDNCRLYKVDVGRLTQQGSTKCDEKRGSFTAFVSADSMNVVANGPAFDALEMLTRWLANPQSLVTRSSDSICGQWTSTVTCAVKGDMSTRFAARLDTFVNTEVRKLASEQIKQEIEKFVAAAAATSDAERKKLVEALLEELPRNDDVLAAIKKALKQ